MAKQAIGLGSTANDGTGDSLRVGGDKINDNFDEIYTTFGDGSTLTPFTTGTSTLTNKTINLTSCLLYTSPSPRDRQKSRMPSSA